MGEVVRRRKSIIKNSKHKGTKAYIEKHNQIAGVI